MEIAILGVRLRIAFAKEEADVALVYHLAREDAHHTKQIVEEEGRSCLLIVGDMELTNIYDPFPESWEI